ncbi:TetR/AcrR family transcriptional regulator [Parvibaculum sp.]|uniref:TetR/AcrR family transcriptional regulator n=1 Tax=Parvibaculum sp. TaxID=2024848 RepID=UPI001B2A4538|nr:TetR/AcrR family transcriptional regulator [Parvibaculum sp.]MBO6634259.1 TetR/AcrR family transcriptional regulator [Parvibaculum sp.]MBO6678821.1 TetR/AcrR family transcriptional regulator [Parvibaculum sp.]MBO6686649.1 TetR/AcrR family transcriptional regulator [Parvibaculum sp.]
MTKRVVSSFDGLGALSRISTNSANSLALHHSRVAFICMLWNDSDEAEFFHELPYMTASQSRQKQDGRRLRSAASRKRIVEAMRDLVREGSVSPRAEEVAARAEVGLRSVFRHFDDMESLYREISELIVAEVRPMLLLPPPSGKVDEIIAEMIERRTKLFERIMPFRTAADANAYRSTFLAQERNNMNAQFRELMRSALPGDIRKDRTFLEALDATLSFDFWRRLRVDQGLSVTQGKRTVEAIASALLAAHRRGKG